MPSNDVEREEDQTLVLALRGSATVFGDKVETLAESLQSALLAYENLATRKRPGSDAFRPVLLPTLKFGENSASGQSFGSMGAFLRDVARVLEARLHEVDSLAELLDSFDSRSLDEIEDIFDFPADDSSDADRRGKIAQELQTLATRSRAKLETSMSAYPAAFSLRCTLADPLPGAAQISSRLLSCSISATSRSSSTRTEQTRTVPAGLTSVLASRCRSRLGRTRTRC